jgi:hypothetical protein
MPLMSKGFDKLLFDFVLAREADGASLFQLTMRIRRGPA